MLRDGAVSDIKMVRKATNWDSYNINPNNFFHRKFFLNEIVKSYNFLLSKIDFKKSIKVLELGSGTGYTNLFLPNKFHIEEITLVDASQKMMDICKKTLKGLDCKKKFIVNNFFDLKLGDKLTAKFDIVHSQGVVEHFENDKRNELIRLHSSCLKKGGYCIIYSPTPRYAYSFFKKLAESFGVWKFTDEIPLDEETLIREMEKNNLHFIDKDYFWKYFLTEVGIIARKL